MTDILLWILLLANLGLVFYFLVSRSRVNQGAQIQAKEIRDELRLAREEARLASREHREELAAALDRIRTVLDARVRELQESNERKLDQMRKVVDEKLQETLDKRLGESFKLVSERLDEMQTLATGVGDLKRVLSNVKVRGTWAEIQLGAILEQILIPEQYGKNVAVTPGAAQRVEFAIRLPGPKDSPQSPIWLPIDSKFPQEDYLRLQEASESGNPEAVAAASAALAKAVQVSAKDIHDKYVNPPYTTDFAIMYLATEGLYAEVLRHPTLPQELHQKYKVIIAGPTSLSAILNSLRMGFQTLAIERRASEVWRVLGAIKTEFGKFGDVLEKVKNQLATATRSIESTGTRSRAIERTLRSVELLPEAEALELLAPPPEPDDDA